MLNACERRLALSYLANMLSRLDRARTAGQNLAEWLEENAPLIVHGGRPIERMRKTASTAAVSAENWRATGLPQLEDGTRGRCRASGR